ncbi:helix-turn-helix domain-containing protein [Ruminococcaceae bacterium OttesenSCG-928-L11]|nr:helix-turn-helix domain-containing protein [Ruminococcaceae bacterium OttesenSCG-928-L11]
MLGERLKRIRKGKRITQDEIAGYLGVKRQTYSAYERGVSIPDSLTLKKIADYFEVSTDYFFQSTEENPPLAQNAQEKKLLLLARRAERIPSAQRDRLIRSFEENIDMFLDALGLADDNDANE